MNVAATAAGVEDGDEPRAREALLGAHRLEEVHPQAVAERLRRDEEQLGRLQRERRTATARDDGHVAPRETVADEDAPADHRDASFTRLTLHITLNSSHVGPQPTGPVDRPAAF